MVTGIAAERLSKIRALLPQKELDAILIANYSPSASALAMDYNLFYLSNLLRRYCNCFLLLTEDDYHLAVDSLEIKRAREDSWLEGVKATPIGRLSAEEYAGLVVGIVREKVSRPRPRLGVNGKRLHASLALALAREADLVDLSRAIEEARLIKDQMEIDLLARAGQVAEAGAKALISALREGMTEWELATVADHAMRKSGAEHFWWTPTLVASGPDATYFNGGDAPTDRKIARGDLVHIDLCPSYRGYNADIARTVVMGTPTPTQLDVIDHTYGAFEKALGALKEGNRVRDVRKAAFEAVAGWKYERFFGGPGHGMGINDDCHPMLSPQNEDMVFQNGMAIAIEVASMVPGLGGVRYEDNFVVDGSSPLRLTRVERLVSIPV